MKFIITTIAIILAITIEAPCETVLDQQHSFTSSIANSGDEFSQAGQTFTVGVAGTLDHIDVLMFRMGGFFDPAVDPLLRVFSTSGGLPTGAPLVSVTSPKASVPVNTAAFVSFSLSSAAIEVDLGEVLAFSIGAAGGSGTYFLLTDQGQSIEYAHGAAVVKFGSNAWQQYSSPQDHGFRTYVIADVVDELFGDYNDNDVIDAADYIVWRKVFASSGTALLHDATPGVVDGDDYNYWRAHYGDLHATGAGTVASTSVPESATSVLLVVGVAACGLRRRSNATGSAGIEGGNQASVSA